MELRDLLNQHRWHLEDLDQLDMIVVHRGAAEDMRTVPGWSITDVRASGVMLEAGLPLEEGDDPSGTFVPYHRFLEIRRGDEVLWRRS